MGRFIMLDIFVVNPVFVLLPCYELVSLNPDNGAVLSSDKYLHFTICEFIRCMILWDVKISTLVYILCNMIWYDRQNSNLLIKYFIY